jgi:hypothetical protein
MGTERRSLILRRGKAGHRLSRGRPRPGGQARAGTDPVHKVTIIPRGRALGLTQQLPVDERHTYPRDYLIGNLAVLMGGRAAEELVLGYGDHRRGQRHRAGHRIGPQDGLRMGHERNGPPDRSANTTSRYSWVAKSRSIGIIPKRRPGPLIKRSTAW